MKGKDLPAFISKVQASNAMIFDNKTKLLLPPAQLQDKDLEALGKQNQTIAMEADEDTAHKATKQLIGNYSQLNSMAHATPMRTPRYQDSVLRQTLEIHNMINV